MPATVPSVTPPADATESGAAFPRPHHWISGILLLLLVAWGTYQLLWDRVPQVCRDELSPAGSTNPDDLVVRVCAPMTATDPRVFLFLLVIALLAVPFFSEIEIPGILRVKRDLHTAQVDLQDLRSSIGVAQTQVANLSSAAGALAMNRTEVNNYFDRSHETGAGQQDLRSGDETVAPTRGAYAQAAFSAAMVGVPRLLEGWEEGTVLVCFTVTADGSFSEPQVHAGHVPGEVADLARNFLNEHPTSSKLTGGADRRMYFTSPARDDDGTIVGGVAVVTPPGPILPGGGMAQMTDMLADVQVVARIYARLLVDLLGESGNLSTTTKAGER